ncbi:MAG: ribosome silencing factor [Burkholderiaceae bacterium]|nr:ribosome silencing factor [Burkholderiaceae bacterium]
MDIRKLQRAIVDGLEDVKAKDIVVFNTEHLSPLFERVIVATGSSNRQTKALAASVRDSVKQRGMQVLRTEGEASGEWIIVDCGAAVAHIMQPAIREYYHLEEIWGEKPVSLKLGAVKTGLVKASEPVAPAKKAAGAKTSAAKTPAKKVAAKKATSKSTAPQAKPAPARKAAPTKAAATVKKAVPAKKAAPASPVTPARAAAPAKRAAPAKKPAPAKKVVARKAAPATKTAPAKKAAAPARKRPATPRT